MNEMFGDFFEMFNAEPKGLPSIEQFLLILLTVAAFGLIVSVTYLLTEKNRVPSQSLALTFVILPVVACTIVMMVGNNFASALSLGGAFTIIRFRSAPGEPKDISYVLTCMAIGLTAGRGFMLYALGVTILFCIFMAAMFLLKYAVPKKTDKILKIIIPEDFNYQGTFDGILIKYAENIIQQKVRTTDLGSLFEITFSLTIQDGTDEKAMIDEIRTLNGNLPVILILKPQLTSADFM